MSARLAALALLAACTACTTRETALFSPDAGSEPMEPPITRCEEALGALSGTPCDLPERCTRRVGPCFLQETVCDAGSIVQLPLFEVPGCIECREDRQCPMPMICDGVQCRACPEGGSCPPCPDGLRPVARNGCETCDCIPPVECTEPGTCGEGLECYRGAVCAPGCEGSLECCANVCSRLGCGDAPAPSGCLTRCPAEVECDGLCVTFGCVCDGRSWRCDAYCAPPEAFPRNGCFHES